MEQTGCSETLTFKLQMLANHPEESKRPIHFFITKKIQLYFSDSVSKI
jgi:hypothetical protein